MNQMLVRVLEFPSCPSGRLRGWKIKWGRAQALLTSPLALWLSWCLTRDALPLSRGCRDCRVSDSSKICFHLRRNYRQLNESVPWNQSTEWSVPRSARRLDHFPWAWNIYARWVFSEYRRHMVIELHLQSHWRIWGALWDCDDPLLICRFRTTDYSRWSSDVIR